MRGRRPSNVAIGHDAIGSHLSRLQAEHDAQLQISRRPSAAFESKSKGSPIKHEEILASPAPQVIYTQPDPRFQEEVKKQISDMDKKHQELMQAMMAQMLETN